MSQTPHLCFYANYNSDARVAAELLMLQQLGMDFIALKFGETISRTFLEDTETPPKIILIKLTYDEEEMKRVLANSESVCVIHHHVAVEKLKTLQKDFLDSTATLELVMKAAAEADNKLAVVYEPDMSVSMLVYKLCKFYEEPVNLLIQMLDNQTMHRNLSPNDAKFSAGLRKLISTGNGDYPRVLGKTLQEVIDVGANELLEHQAKFEYFFAKQFAQRSRYILFEQYPCILMEAPAIFANDLVDRLGDEVDCDVVGTFLRTTEGEIVFSLRARKGTDTDVLSICANHGKGGGQRNAAGFTTKDENVMKPLL